MIVRIKFNSRIISQKGKEEQKYTYKKRARIYQQAPSKIAQLTNERRLCSKSRLSFFINLSPPPPLFAVPVRNYFEYVMPDLYLYILKITAVSVYEVAFMFHVDKNVIARYSVATRALNPVSKTAHLVKNPAKTPANTASARENVASLANLTMRNALGSASIRNAPDYAASVVMNPAINVLLASIPALVCAGKDARRSAESLTRTKSRKSFSEPKATRT